MQSSSAVALASDITILNKNVSKWEIDLGTWLGELVLGPVPWNFAECGFGCSNEENVFVVLLGCLQTIHFCLETIPCFLSFGLDADGGKAGSEDTKCVPNAGYKTLCANMWQ